MISHVSIYIIFFGKWRNTQRHKCHYYQTRVDTD